MSDGDGTNCNVNHQMTEQQVKEACVLWVAKNLGCERLPRTTGKDRFDGASVQFSVELPKAGNQ